MNSESNSKDLNSSSDQLTDALLAEHARLGTGSDADLVKEILLKTIDAPIDISQYTPAESKSFGLAEWAKVAAAVVAILGLGALALNQMSTGPEIADRDQRTEETNQVVN